MISEDEAITQALRKYREIYPRGELPERIEDAAVLTHFPDASRTVTVVSFSIRNRSDPFVLFRVAVDRESGVLTVDTAVDWHELTSLELANSSHL